MRLVVIPAKVPLVLNSNRTEPEGLASLIASWFSYNQWLMDESWVCERPTWCVSWPTDCNLADYKTIIKKLYLLNLSAFPVIIQSDHENILLFSSCISALKSYFHHVFQSEQHISVDWRQKQIYESSHLLLSQISWGFIKMKNHVVILFIVTLNYVYMYIYIMCVYVYIYNVCIHIVHDYK